ncbi:lysozyme inhibitor LprI family protein [Pseudomonas sp. Ant30-3]|uniref:lysozyme inhibitor LprI family protein n=1 Tax=Pseudomonas sp. Ant30-3 TaxID=1488328 RepID=UPI001F302D3D|nr:lysozyme inhibitor LprI family protein [Pseudomonas sp. Ant30-3]
MNKFFLLVMFFCTPVVAAEPIFQTLKSCAQDVSVTNSCSVVLDSNGYVIDAGSDQKLSDTAEPTGALNLVELYRDGSRYVLAHENFSRAQSRRWLVFGYEGGRIQLQRIYIFSLDTSKQSGPYWHGYDCRPDSEPFTPPSGVPFSESAMQALCGDVEGDVVVVPKAPGISIPSKSWAVSVPVYRALTRVGAATYLFRGSEEPELQTFSCLSNCVSSTSEKAETPAGTASSKSSVSASAKETCNPDSFTNPDLIMCGQQSFERVDAVLNEQYKNTLTILAPADKKQLTDVQRKWVRFKEAYCEDMYLATFPGAEAPIDKLVCLARATTARLGELIYLQTGLPNDGFYKAASLMAGQDGERGLKASINLLAGGDFDDPVWKQYADAHCEMSFRLFREGRAHCVLRMRFQLPMNR